MAIGVPVAMALTAWAKKDKDLLKDAVYVGTSVASAKADAVCPEGNEGLLSWLYGCTLSG